MTTIKKCPIHNLEPKLYGSWPDDDDTPVTVFHCPEATWDEHAEDEDGCFSGAFVGCKNHIMISDETDIIKALEAWNDKVGEK